MRLSLITPTRAVALRSAVALVAAASAAAALTIDGGGAAARSGPGLTSAGPANHRVAGEVEPNSVSRELRLSPVAVGANPVEKPTDGDTHYGYNADNGTAPQVAVPPSAAEAQKTEPDKNTYLVLKGQRGADPSYDYGTHFLIQGHEAGKVGYVTRINLDADAAHRVTVLATRTADGATLPAFDGSTWNPFTRTVLMTAELGNKGGVWELSPTFGAAHARNLNGSIGQGGYEGIEVDPAGELWIVEDVGGAAAGANGKGKQPNSFVYRFVPNLGDLTSGRLQALQVVTAPTPLLADSAFETAVHTYGSHFDTRWVTLHDTAVDGTVPFDANALAKAKGATPFKRPENGLFRPGRGFRQFVFTETGDTNADSPFNATQGGWGAVFSLTQAKPTSSTGTLQPVFIGDREHTGLDNLSFWDDRNVAVVEDAGDGLHQQRNALDSAYLIDVTHDYSTGPAPLRFLAEGRDASATLDTALGGQPGFTNEGDNEITGIHISDGDASPQGLFGTRVPRLFRGPWRAFWTQQHGDNTTWELLPADRDNRDD